MTLVLLPGMDGTGLLFAPFIAALGSDLNVKVVSYPTSEALSYSELEAVARAAIPAQGPYIILGESFSGPIAIALAASSSSRLKGLVLCCSFARNPRPAFSRLRALVSVLPLGWAPVTALAPLLLGRFATAALKAALAESLSQLSPSAIRARLQGVLSVDASAKLAAVKVPLLYLRASGDRVVPSSASAIVAGLCSSTRIVELEAPHFLLQAVPVKAAAEVQGFISEVQNAL